jgi:2-polyprenyl-3-methyl-5-hydroxy-6-metoxy-1,4-benzoquinol methylase
MVDQTETDAISEAAAQRFSDTDSARKWTDMYASDTERLDEANFRRRRDITVDYVLKVLPKGGRVLDVGCGAAPVVSELRRRGVACTGLEYAEDMIKHARERLRSMGLDDSDVHQGDCRKTSFEDGRFDVVISLGVISYVEHYDEALAEIHRLLRPGGFALISFRNRFNPILSDPVRASVTGIKALLGKLPPEPYKIGRFMDHREFQQKMQEHGFAFRDFFGVGFGPFKLHGRKLFAEKTAIRLSNTLARGFGAIGLQWPFRWLADVSLWVYQKDAGRGS